MSERPLQPPHRADVVREDQYEPGNEDYEYDKRRQQKLDEESEMKLCKDCAWFIVNNSKCAKAPMPVDYVRGGERGYFDAQVMRESPVTGCGHDAKWFKIIPVAA